MMTSHFARNPGLALALAAVCLGGCTYKQLVIGASFTMAEEAIDAFYAEPDAQLAADAAPANLKLIEGMANGDPENEELQLAASQLIGMYAFGFLEDCCVDEDQQAAANQRAKGLYKRAMAYSRVVLDDRSDFDEIVDLDVVEFEKRLKSLDKDDVPALFWTAFNWGLYINLSRDDLSALADLPKVVAMAKRSAELDSDFFYGGAHLFLMVYNASMGMAVGGSPQAAKEAFEAARKASDGAFLMTQYLFAKYYTQQTLDRELFEELLSEVLAASEDGLPEMRLANVLAKEKARRLLPQADDLF